MCVLRLCCGGVAADVPSDFALLPLYGVIVTDTPVAVIHTCAADRAGPPAAIPVCYNE